MEKAGEVGARRMIAGSGVAAAVERFVELVHGLHESQYGDFMRRTSNYLLRLEQEIGGRGNAGQIFADIRMRLIFRPNFDVESTRRFVVEKTELFKAIG